MRKLFAFIVLNLFVSALFAQNTYTEKLDSVVSPSYKIIYRWDNNGNLVIKETFAKRNNNWVDSVKVESTWNEDNTLNTKVYSFYNDGIMSSRFKCSCIYDEYITIKEYKYVDDEWLPTAKYITDSLQGPEMYTGWEHFNVLYKNYFKFYGWINNAWFEQEERIVKDGITCTRSWSKSSDGSVSGYGEDSKLNKNRDIIYSITYNYENGDFLPISKFEADVDENDNIISSISYKFTEDVFVPIDKNVTTYYSSGNKKSTKSYQYIEGSWILKSECEFDEKYNCTLYWYHDYSDNSITYGVKNIHEYDSKNNKTKYVIYDWQNNNWKEIKSYLIENSYDLDGRLKKVEWNVQNNNGYWVTQKKDVFEYGVIDLFDSYSITEYHNYDYYSNQCTNIPTGKRICNANDDNSSSGLVDGERVRNSGLARFKYDSSTNSWSGNDCFATEVSNGNFYDWYMFCNVGNGQLALYCQNHSEWYENDEESIWWAKTNAAGWCQPTSEMVLISYSHTKTFRDTNISSNSVLCDYNGNKKLYDSSYNADGNETSRTTYYYSNFVPTGIADIKSSSAQENDIYNMQGQKINSLHKGDIYIQNGKKYIAR